MSDKHEKPASGPTPGPTDSSRYDQWFDGLLDEREARRERARIDADPKERARFEADRAIESSLRRSFGASAPARPLLLGRAPGTPRARKSAAWVRYGIAAGVLAVLGAALAINSRHGDSKNDPSKVSGRVPPKLGVDSVGKVAENESPRAGPRVRTAQYSLGDVFLDALALDFQPLLGCQAQDPWDAELFAQLADAPCNRDEGVVVLGEWVDPRLDVANMLMLRRGENPIMLVVPRCEEDTELCVPKDSGLYVHRGMRDGRAIYEISPVSGSEVLGCVEAKNVVTQQQF